MSHTTSLTLCGLCTGVGLPLTVGAWAFRWNPVTPGPDLGWAFYIGILLTVVGVVAGLAGIARLPSPVLADGTTKSDILYRRHLVGIGFVMLVVATTSLVGLAGLTYVCLSDAMFQQPASDKAAHDDDGQSGSAAALTESSGTQSDRSNGDVASGQQKTQSPGNRQPAKIPPQRLAHALALLVSLGMALLGGLFFVANALRLKRDEFEEFEETLFWGGLWYRLGEAVLFTLVFYVTLRTFAAPAAILWLPLLALFLGMFVKSGERLVFGLARRVFLATTSLLPLQPEDIDASFRIPTPKPPLNVSAERGDNGSSLVVKWAPPDDGPIVRSFIVEFRKADAPWQYRTAPPDATIETVTGLNPEAVYTVRVVASNDAGRSRPSPSVTITPVRALVS